MVPELQKFRSYLPFLRALYQDAKRTNPSLTQAEFGRRLGMGGSTFKMILAGKRRLSSKSAACIGNALRLSPEGQEFLEALRQLENASTESERKTCRARMTRRKNELKIREVRLTDRAFLADLYLPSLWIYLTDILKAPSLENLDEAELGRKVGIGLSRLRPMIRTLQALALPNKTQGLHIIFDRLSHVVSQKNYLHGWFQEGQRRLEKDYSRPDTYFGSTTIPLSDEEFLEFKCELKSLIARYLDTPRAGSQIDRRVFQASFQAFPVFPE